MKTQAKGPFLGINNRKPNFSLHVTKTGDFLADAVNVDIDGAGNIVRRKSAELVQAVTGAHSMHGSYLVRASVLYKITLPAYTETLVKVLSSNSRMSYAEFNGDLYFSNGVDSGRISSDGNLYPWALPTPQEPTVTTVSGSMFAGSYQVAVSYYNATTGEEGGVSASNNYEIEGNRALRVSLPSATSGATHINVYCSTVDGSIPLLQTSVAVGALSVDITSVSIGRGAQQRYEAPLPAGTRIFVFNSQLCSVKGNDLFYGIPSKLGYYLPHEGRVPFPDPVETAIGAQMGVYVSTSDLTHFFPGTQLGQNLDGEIVRDVLPYGGVFGTEFESPNKANYGWFGKNGIVIASTQGEVEPVMSDVVNLTPPASGVSTVFETRGYRRVVSCGWCVNLDTLSVTRYEGYEFTSTSGGYGTTNDGIFLLEGDGDIPYLVDFGRENFGTEAHKHLPAIYLGVDSIDKMKMRVQTTQHDYTYEARSSSGDLQIQRIDPGKGLRGNWFNLSLVSDGGPEFTLASVSYVPTATNRRI